MAERKTLSKRWVPDDESTKCGNCDNEFGLFTRRHHCRNCGDIFCYYCSTNFTKVPDPVSAPGTAESGTSAPLRVCDPCFKLLVGARDDADSFSVYEPNTQHWVTEADATIKIKYAKTGPGAAPARTVFEVFDDCVKRLGNSTALKWEEKDDQWKSWTWSQYREEVYAFARALVKKGLKRYQSVNIIGFNSPEWFFANLGAIAAGGFAAGIYTTNGPQACKYISEHSEAAFVVVEDNKQLQKFLEIRDDLPALKAIVMWKGDVPADANAAGKVPVMTYREFVESGNGDDRQQLQQEVMNRIGVQEPGNCCTLIYTSGTTGNPKAVMISHDNATWTSKLVRDIMPPSPEPQEVGVSYLPLSHIAAQMNDIHAPMAMAADGRPVTIYFARPTALKGTLGDTLRAARPTWFFGVPRVWEKMQEKMLAIGAKNTGLKKSIGAWAKGKGLEYFHATSVTGDKHVPSFLGLADSLVFSKVRAGLGFDRCRFCATGAAPISKATLEYFGSLNIPVCELYGMSECSGPQTICRYDYRQLGSCGSRLRGTELKIDHDPSRDKPGNGEICYRGRHIMMGYLRNPDKTKASIDADGWLHSGDVGRLDDNGMLYITGRIKELLVTAGGENVAPVPIEEKVTTACPAISKVMMIGDKRKYCTCLVTLKCKPTDDGTGYTEELDGAALEVNPECKTVSDAIKDETWQKYIQSGLDAANATAVSNAQKLQKFRVLPTDFSVADGLLTSTLKLKRPQVVEKYADLIEDMYTSK